MPGLHPLYSPRVGHTGPLAFGRWTHRVWCSEWCGAVGCAPAAGVYGWGWLPPLVEQLLHAGTPGRCRGHQSNSGSDPSNRSVLSYPQAKLGTNINSQKGDRAWASRWQKQYKMSQGQRESSLQLTNPRYPLGFEDSSLSDGHLVLEGCVSVRRKDKGGRGGG